MSKFPMSTIRFCPILLTFICLYFLNLKAQDNFTMNYRDEAPIVDYVSETVKTVDASSTKNAKFFDGKGAVIGNWQIEELPPGVEPLPTNAHFWIGLSPLPVDKSDIIVIGEITETKGHLSADKTGIYSEFVMKVSEVFKDQNKSINVEKDLSVFRLGCSVRFASGRINKYRIHNQGMPQKGEKYLFFLKEEVGEVYMILTGYKIAHGKITPLDGEESKSYMSDLPFAKYRGADEATVIQELKTALLTK